jgi:hypothetical protein
MGTMNPHLLELIDIMQSMEARCYEPNADPVRIAYFTNNKLQALQWKMQLEKTARSTEK